MWGWSESFRYTSEWWITMVVQTLRGRKFAKGRKKGSENERKLDLNAEGEERVEVCRRCQQLRIWEGEHNAASLLGGWAGLGIHVE